MTIVNQKKYGAFLGYVYTGLQSVISVVYIPILLNGIGKSEYGLYQIVGSVISYFAAMESPLCASILKYYVEYKVNKDEVNMENVLAIGRRIFFALSLIMVLLAIPSFFLMNVAFADKFTSAELLETQLMFVLMIVNLLIGMNSYVYVAVINANERFVFLKLTALISLILQPIAVVLLISRFKYAFVIVVIQLVLNVFLTIIRLYYAKKILNCSIVYHGKDKALIKGMLALSLATFFVAIADQIFWRTDQLILGSMCGPDIVAEYSIGAQFNTMYITVACVLGGLLLPVVTKLVVQGDNKAISDYFAKIGRYQSYIVALMLFGVIAFGREFVLIIAGEGFEISYSVALLLMVPYAIDLIQTSGGAILTAKNMFGYRAKVLFIAAVINIFLTIAFVKLFGVVGAALATTVSIILSSGFVMNYIYKVKLNLNLSHFFKEVVPIWVLGVLSLPIAFFIINRIVFSNMYMQFVVHCLLFVLVYGLLMFVVMNKEEKQLVLSKLVKNKQ